MIYVDVGFHFSGPTRYRQDGDISDRRLPPREADRRTGPRLCSVQHCGGPADGEDPQDRSEGRASVC